MLSTSDRENLPTENLSAERYLARFGNLAAQSAAHSNRFFKAKRIRDDLLFEKQGTSNVELASSNILKKLDAMELSWTAHQKEKMKKKLVERINKSQKDGEFTNQLVHRCKEHGGPFTQVNDLKAVSTEDPVNLKKILRIEIQYQ